MATFTTFYLSRLVGKKVFSNSKKVLGVVKDVLADTININDTNGKPIITGLQLKTTNGIENFSIESFRIIKKNTRYKIKSQQLIPLPKNKIEDGIFLYDTIMDKQIVDMNGRKLVRVNDVRIVQFRDVTCVIAVDIGFEGLLRRIGVVTAFKKILSLFNKTIPSKFILWEDVGTVNFSNQSIQLSKSSQKLQTLHPSDLADIIEDLAMPSREKLFTSLDEEHAADVLEELETESQVQLLENLPVEKMAQVLEKMSADDVADILEEIEDDKAEILLNNMEEDTSKEVRELLEYSQNDVGSIMKTEVLQFKKEQTVGDVLQIIRDAKPDEIELYKLFVVDDKEKFVATFTLRDLLIAPPETKIEAIMEESPVLLKDNQELDDIAEMMSKYNMLAIPVVDDENILQGMVVVEDVVDDLIDKRRTNK